MTIKMKKLMTKAMTIRVKMRRRMMMGKVMKTRRRKMKECCSKRQFSDSKWNSLMRMNKRRHQKTSLLDRLICSHTI
jgi:hypothetical protein